MPKPTFAEQLWNGLADVVADIREKVVEEPWFGRAVTERGEMPDTEPGAGFGSLTRTVEPNALWSSREQRGGLDGEILPPESDPARPSGSPRLEHGTVLDGRPADYSMWRQAAPGEQKAIGSSVTEREPERDVDRDIDR
jgi:hypothetical protein